MSASTRGVAGTFSRQACLGQQIGTPSSSSRPPRQPTARRWHRQGRSALPVAQAPDDRRFGRQQRDNGANGGLDPALERAVPPEQRPVNELKQLRQTTLYSWVG